MKPYTLNILRSAMVAALFVPSLASAQTQDELNLHQDDDEMDEAEASEYEPLFIIWAGIGTSMSVINERDVSFTNQVGFTMDAAYLAIDIAAAFDHPGVFDISGVARMTPVPDWRIVPSIGVGLSWYNPTKQDSGYDGLGLIATAAAHTYVGQFDFGLNYTAQALTTPQPDGDTTWLPVFGQRHTVMFTTGIAF